MVETADIQDTPIGPLPADWKLARLGDISSETCERNQSLQFCRDDVLTVDNQEGLIPSERKLGEDFSRYKIVRENDFAYNPMRLNVGSIGYWEKSSPGIVSPDYIVFRCDEQQADPRYVNYLRRSAAWWKQINQSGQGSIRIRYYYRHIAQFFVPLPPLAEQRSIACVLRIVQEATEATEKVIAACHQLKRALMRHLFTFGPVPFDQADRAELKETEVGPMPENWQAPALSEVISVAQYGLSVRGEAQGQYPILRMNNLQNGRVVPHDLQFVNLDEDLFSKFRLNVGDLLFNRTNSYDLVGKTSIFDLEDAYVFASYLIRVVPRSDRLLPDFLNFFLNLPSTQNSLKALATRGVSQSNINATKLRGIAVPIPPLAEQRQIAALLLGVQKKAESEATRKYALTTLFTTLLHDLMTGKVRVV